MKRLRAVLLSGLLVLCATVASAARFDLRSNDPDGSGINDPTPADPVIGNPGTTLGEQRFNVMSAAVREWGNRVASNALIVVNTDWLSLNCGPTTGTLAAAGPAFVLRDFDRAPKANTWYVPAVASALLGFDLRTLFPPDAGVPEEDVSVIVNQDVGTAGCLTPLSWGYEIGATAKDPLKISLYDTLLHELAHGLGFLSVVDPETGEFLLGFNDAYSRNLEDHSRAKRWFALDDAGRTASAIDTNDLHWVGRNVAKWAERIVRGGHDRSSHINMFAPDPLNPGSSVSHFDTTLFGNANELMEPFATPIADLLLTQALMQDVGWSTNSPKVRELENVDGAGKQDLAALFIGQDPPGHRVRVFDPSTAILITEITVPSEYSAIDLQVVDNFGGSSASEVAVLAYRLKSNRVRVFVYDALTGQLLKTLTYPAGYPKRLVRLPDYADGPADELAVLGISEGFTPKLVVKDSASNNAIRNASYPKWQPVDLDWVPSFGGTSAPEVVVVFNDVKTGRGRLHIRDGDSGEALASHLLPEGFLPQLSTTVRSYGGTDAREIAILGLDLKGKPWVHVLDPSSGELLMSRSFTDELILVGFETVKHFRSTSQDELAIVGKRAANLNTKLIVIDAKSGTTIGSGAQPAKEDLRDIAVVSSLAGARADDILLLSIAAPDGFVRIYQKDGNGQQLGILLIGDE